MNPIGVPTEEKIHLSLNHPLVYEGLTVDFQNGTITCTRTKTHKIVEYVTFSFSVALLYNLCVPRSEWTPEKHARKDNVEAIPGENMSFMRAAGLLLFYTPSNFFMYRTFPVLFCTRCADERPLSDSCGNESDQRQRVINSDKGDFRDCCGGDIGDVNDKETLIHVHSLKIKDIAKANGFSPESLFQLKEAGLLYSTPYHVNIYYNYGANVYARCTARHSVPEACGIELDQSRCVINSNNGELGGEKGSHKGNDDGTDKGVGDNKNVRSADGNNGNVGVVGVVCGNDRFRDGGRGGHYGDVDYGCGERGGFGGGCGAGGCRGGGACGGGCGGGGCGGGGGGGGCGGCGCD